MNKSRRLPGYASFLIGFIVFGILFYFIQGWLPPKQPGRDWLRVVAAFLTGAVTGLTVWGVDQAVTRLLNKRNAGG